MSKPIYSIVAVYANPFYLPEDTKKENPIPEKVFFSAQAFEKEYGSELMLEGFTICEKGTTNIASFSEDFYDTREEALEALEEHIQEGDTNYNVIIFEEVQQEVESNQTVEFHYLIKKELGISKDKSGDPINSKVKVSIGFINPLTDEEIDIAHKKLLPLDFAHLIPSDRLKYIIPVTKEEYDKSDY